MNEIERVLRNARSPLARRDCLRFARQLNPRHANECCGNARRRLKPEEGKSHEEKVAICPANAANYRSMCSGRHAPLGRPGASHDAREDRDVRQLFGQR